MLLWSEKRTILWKVLKNQLIIVWLWIVKDFILCLEELAKKLKAQKTSFSSFKGGGGAYYSHHITVYKPHPPPPRIWKADDICCSATYLLCRVGRSRNSGGRGTLVLMIYQGNMEWRKVWKSAPPGWDRINWSKLHKVRAIVNCKVYAVVELQVWW